MSGDLPQTSHSLLERLDVAIASRLSQGTTESDLATSAQRFQARLFEQRAEDARFIASLLRLRGFVIMDEDAADVLSRQRTRFRANDQEWLLIRGLTDVLQMVRDRASQGIPPDGWFLVEAFKVMTRGVARFRNNVLRQDQPWDAVLYVRHPAPEDLRFLLDTFNRAHRYRDMPRVFDGLHPVRQAFRLLWRFCRIAPFPDLNQLMAWIAMDGYLLSKGYPMLVPQQRDRELLARLVGGPAPLRLVQFESRLLEQVAGDI